MAGLAVAVIVFACSLSGWLTQPDLQGLIWPDDINVSIIRALGGTVSQNAVGEAVSELSPVSCAARLLMVALAAAFVGWLRCRASETAMRERLLPNLVLSAVLLTASSAWWLIRLVGEFGIPSAVEFASGVLPLWLCMTAALWFWLALQPWLPQPACPETDRPEQTVNRRWLPFSVVLGCIVGWIAVSFWMNFCLYKQLFIPHGDSAMYEEHLWNILHGKGFRSYLDQGLFLGEHFQFIHLLLLPLHAVWPSHLLLELTESVALASCSVPIYLIAVRHSGSRAAAALLAIAWLFYFPMHFLDIAIDQKSFRPIALGLPFLFWLIEFAERRQLWRAAGCLLLVLSAKEDMALITFPLMAVLAVNAWQQQRNPEGVIEEERNQLRTAAKWFGGLALFSLVYVLFVVTIGIPAFRSGEAVHYSRYFGELGSSPGELARTAFTQPQLVLARLFSVRTLLYALVFLMPLAFIPLRRVLYLAAACVTFTMLSLMELGDSATDLPPIPYHHFHAPLLPVIFWAAIAGIGRCNESTSTDRTGYRRFVLRNVTAENRAALILACCISTCLTGSLMPCGLTFWSDDSAFGRNQLYTPTDPAQQERAAMAQVVVDQIPKSARVASTDFIHTRLTHCERSYDYSDYVRKVNDYQKGVPADTDYIVIDTGHRYSTIRSAADVPELQQEDSPWVLLPDNTNGRFLILQRQEKQ